MVNCRYCGAEQTERGTEPFDAQVHFGVIDPRGALVTEDSKWKEIFLCPTCGAEQVTALSSSGRLGADLVQQLIQTVDAEPPS